MITPVRLQLSRKKGFSLQAHSRAVNGLVAVNVARPSKWGNPYFPGCGRIGYGFFDENMQPFDYNDRDPRQCVLMFRFRMLDMARDPNRIAAFGALILPLRCHNLACWCKPGDHCHADVLLFLANRPPIEPGKYDVPLEGHCGSS